MFKLVVLSALLAVAAARPGYLHGGVAAYAAPAATLTYAAPAVVAAPLTATAITKNVHYASTPVVTGYTSTVLKPNLGSLVTPAETVSQEKVLAPGRSVATITPQITHVQPEITVQKVPVDVPVATPVISKVATVHTAYAAPAYAAYAAAPGLATYAAAPAVTTYTAGLGVNTVAYNTAGGVHIKTLAGHAIL